jgi:hypothetical protein
MKRTALCLVAVALLLGIYVQNADAASITLLNMTRAYTGARLSPTVVVSGASGYTISFLGCYENGICTGVSLAPWTLYGPTSTAPIGSNAQVSNYKVTVTTLGGNPNVTKTGIFKINPPTTTLGGGTIGSGSTGDIIWAFDGLWSGDEGSGSWYAPTSLAAELPPDWSMRNITVTTYGTPTGEHVDTLVPLPGATAVLSSVAKGLVSILNDTCSILDGHCDAMGTGSDNGFAWNSIIGANDFESTFGFTLDSPGIPIYYIPDTYTNRTDPYSPLPPDVVKVSYQFAVGSLPDPITIDRTWAIDYVNTHFQGDSKCLGPDGSTICTDNYVAFIETTPEPLPPIPLPDDLTVLSASYTKVAQTRLLLGWWAYKYRLNLQNGGTEPLANVCGKVKSGSSSVKVIDPEVCFLDIPAGGSATSKGTFSFMAKSADTSSLSWIYSSLKIAADPSGPFTEAGTHPLSYYVTLSTSAPQPYYILFHQWIPAGITVIPDAPLGWETSEANTWTVTQDVTVPAATTSEIRAGAWLLNTLQKAQVTVPIEVPAP